MAFSGDVQVVPEPGVQVQQPAVEACNGGSGSPETTTTTKEESVMTVLQEKRNMGPELDQHEDAVAPEQAAEVSASSEEAEEEKPPVAKEEAEHKAPDVDDHQGSTRERLKRHRQEVAGRVWVPEMWGQEKLLKVWMDCAVFDQPLVPAGLLTARRALVAESRTRRPDRTSTVSSAGSSPLQMRRTGAPTRSGAQSLLPPAASS